MISAVALALIAGVIISVFTVLGDAIIKHASLQTAFTGWRWLVLGAVIYAITAFGWFFVMKKIKLSTAVVLYSVSCIILLTLISVFYFKEKISPVEIIGIGMAVAFLIILARFA